MKFPRVLLATLLSVAAHGCAGKPAPRAQPAPPIPNDPPATDPTPAPTRPGPATVAKLEALYQARADSALSGYHAADVHFMTGMIGHHAQALVMSGFAPENGASPTIRTLCARIINAQKDEIDIMQTWLRDRGEQVPEIHIADGHLMIHGPEHAHHMPGMLSPEQLDELRHAKGTDFDRLFLRYMIMHHKGAVTMVLDLFATDGAAQDDFVFKLASDIQADQGSEIERMELMLEELGGAREQIEMVQAAQSPGLRVDPPTPDPRVGLEPGMFDAGEAIWNLRMLSTTPPPEEFVGTTNSDLAFTGNYAIQGNYNGIQVWDISDPRNPTTVVTYVCPASQSDVSVYDNLLFVSGEGRGGRLDCGEEGVSERVSHERLRGIRIFDISDIANPKYVANVQTCRGSHTHTVLKHPGDDENVYIYVSGSSFVRPAEELPGCSGLSPAEDPNSALFRIEVIRVPLGDPTAAAIVTSPRIFQGLVAPPRHGLSPADLREIAEAREAGAFVAMLGGRPRVMPERFVTPRLDSIVAARGGEGAPTAADSAALQALFDEQARLQAERMAARADEEREPRPGPSQCHDITVYPAIGLAGGACGGYGLLLDITDPTNPVRLAAVADSNFSYWHSATFSNDGSKIMFTDEWGGGGAPKCRVDDPMEWGANAVFTIEDGEMVFRSYYKMPAPQTRLENCVAHNGSLIPVPGRDIMVQGWYQGGISLVDWTDPRNPVEIAFHDRGPFNPERMESAGSWSVYWYNGVIVNSEIKRGLDIFELTPGDILTRNEIDAANSVVLTQLNSQGQPVYEWPATFALARAYLDQLERWRGMPEEAIAAARQDLGAAEAASGTARADALRALAERLQESMVGATDERAARVQRAVDAVLRLVT